MSQLHFLPVQLGGEFKTIKAMVTLYCRAHHYKQAKSVPCRECAEFIAYASDKSACRKRPVPATIPHKASHRYQVENKS